MIVFGAALPPNQFDGEPFTLFFDPEREIPNRLARLQPFVPMIHLCHHVNTLLGILPAVNSRNLVLLFISNNQHAIEVRRFLATHILPLPNLRLLFVIFPDGLQYHGQWSHIISPSLHWCRSFTTNIVNDALEVCNDACNAHISYYEQRRLEAEDRLSHDADDSARAIVQMFAIRKRHFVRLLHEHVISLLG